MIIEFSVKNFRSIRDLQTLSFVATPLKSPEKYISVDESNVIKNITPNLLRTVGIYGANASGKSNILRAFNLFVSIIFSLPSPEPYAARKSEPFLYQDEGNEESFFQMVFEVKGKKYRYGFTLSGHAIVAEWLYGPSENESMVKYFIREGAKKMQLGVTFKEESKSAPGLEYSHIPYLTHVASYKKGVASSIWETLRTRIIPQVNRAFYRYSSVDFIQKVDGGKKSVLDLLVSFGLPYSDIILDPDESNDIEKPFPLSKIEFIKSVSLQNGEEKSFKLNLGKTESAGTQKLFDLSVMILIGLHRGHFMIIDELDSNFHPALVLKLIGLFNDPQVNTKGAQLLFTSHNTNLLSPTLMRRDQFYFTEKDSFESTKLYSLADLKGIRNDADFAQQYLSGFYGALPVLSSFLQKDKTALDE